MTVPGTNEIAAETVRVMFKSSNHHPSCSYLHLFNIRRQLKINLDVTKKRSAIFKAWNVFEKNSLGVDLDSSSDSLVELKIE